MSIVSDAVHPVCGICHSQEPTAQPDMKLQCFVCAGCRWIMLGDQESEKEQSEIIKETGKG